MSFYDEVFMGIGVRLSLPSHKVAYHHLCCSCICIHKRNMIFSYIIKRFKLKYYWVFTLPSSMSHVTNQLENAG